LLEEGPRRAASVRAQILSKSSQIRFATLDDGGSAAFVLLDTLQKIPEHRRFNFFFVPRGNKRYTVFIDPALFEEEMGADDNLDLLVQIAKRNGRAFTSHRLWKEIKEVSGTVRARLAGEPIRTDQKLVDWINEYPTNAKRSFSVADWFEKGRFKTEKEVEDYLGINHDEWLEALAAI
jgi:hypothetical protein